MVSFVDANGRALDCIIVECRQRVILNSFWAWGADACAAVDGLRKADPAGEYIEFDASSPTCPDWIKAILRADIPYLNAKAAEFDRFAANCRRQAAEAIEKAERLESLAIDYRAGNRPLNSIQES
jgi:hypothetical protein